MISNYLYLLYLTLLYLQNNVLVYSGFVKVVINKVRPRRKGFIVYTFC